MLYLRIDPIRRRWYDATSILWLMKLTIVSIWSKWAPRFRTETAGLMSTVPSWRSDEPYLIKPVNSSYLANLSVICLCYTILFTHLLFTLNNNVTDHIKIRRKSAILKWLETQMNTMNWWSLEFLFFFDFPTLQYSHAKIYFFISKWNIRSEKCFLKGHAQV